jgi:phage FluMu gp28-like protein
MGLNLLLYYAINHPDSYNVLVSPVFSQSKKSFLDLSKACGKSNPLIESTNASELLMMFRNGSTIRMVSAESDDNLRGFTVSGILVIDEAAFMAENVWTEILSASTMIRGKKVLFISTPSGTNWFKRIFEFGDNEQLKDWNSYRITSFDNPYLARETLELARITLPEKSFLQEYLGVFIEGSGSVFGGFGQCAVLESLKTSPEPGRKYYAGLDLAIANDFTVLTVFDDNGDLVDFYRNNKTSWEEIILDVAERINKWRAHTVVEKNNIGSVIVEQLEKLCPNLIEAFTTTQDSKKDIVELLKISFTQKKIKIPKKEVIPTIHLELNSFNYKLSPNGKLSYSAPGGMTDDIVLSLCFSNKAFIEGIARGKYHTMSGGSHTKGLSEINKFNKTYVR